MPKSRKKNAVLCDRVLVVAGIQAESTCHVIQYFCLALDFLNCANPVNHDKAWRLTDFAEETRICSGSMTRVDVCAWSDRIYEWVAVNGPFNLLSCLWERYLLQSGTLVSETKLERDIDENLIPRRRMRKEPYQSRRSSAIVCAMADFPVPAVPWSHIIGLFALPFPRIRL